MAMTVDSSASANIDNDNQSIPAVPIHAVPIHAVIDGQVFRHHLHGGIARLFCEQITYALAADPQLSIDVLLDDSKHLPASLRSQVGLLQWPQVQAIQKWLRPSRLWQALAPNLLPKLQQKRQLAAWQHWLAAKPHANHLWHSTYYTLPPYTDIPTVVSVYDMIHEKFPELFSSPDDERVRQKKRLCIESATRIMAISATTKQDIMDYYDIPAARIDVVPLAASDVFCSVPNQTPDQAAQRRLQHCNQPFFLYVGRRSHHKNFAALLQAYASWPQRQAVQLRVVGPAWTSSEQQLLHELGVAEHCRLEADIDDDTLRDHYQHAAALVYPSLYEGFGIPLVEAMRCGCPIIASDIPSSREVAQDAALYLTDHAAPSAYHQAFDHCLQPAVAQQQATAGPKVAAQYSWQKAGQQMAAIYRLL